MKGTCVTSDPAALRQADSERDELVRIFHRDLGELGRFHARAPADLPPVPRQLLAHDQHMTVTVEAHHGCPVRVDVLHTWETDTVYAREILLRRTSDDAVVQFGIVRLRWAYLGEAVRAEIQARRRPLGRILIEHDVLRTVECRTLWEVSAGACLAAWTGLPEGGTTYGRTARIHVEGRPAIELLEIVVPDEAIGRRRRSAEPEAADG